MNQGYAVGPWMCLKSLTSLQRRLMKTGDRVVKHARCCWLLLAERHLNRKLFGYRKRD